MSIRICRFLAIMCCAISLTAALAHLLEMPVKLGYDGGLWLTLQQSLYQYFGKLAGPFEPLAMLAAVVLAFLLRGRGAVFGWALVAALCLIATHAIYWLLVEPVNQQVADLSAQAAPDGWQALRAQWEYSHAVRAVLQLAALGALVWSSLLETRAAPAATS